MSELEELISKNKKLSSYRGSNINLDKDAARSAKPFGWRFKGKHDYRVPTEDEVKRGVKKGKVYTKIDQNVPINFQMGVEVS